MWKSLHNKHGIAFKQCGLLGQVPSPGLLRLHWLGHLPALLAPLASLPLKVLLNTTRKVKCPEEGSHLSVILKGTLVKSVMLKDCLYTLRPLK